MLAFDGEYYGFLLTRKINIQNFCNVNVLIDILESSVLVRKANS